jgi:hypothetical protein
MTWMKPGVHVVTHTLKVFEPDKLLRYEVLCPTEDDWAPNFNSKGVGDKQGNFVKVMLMVLPSNGKWRVRVTGADDDSMERDFETNDFPLASIVYDTIAGWDVVSKKKLSELNFIRG